MRLKRARLSVMKKVEIYTDGACSGNPGLGGWGAVLLHGENRLELSDGEKLTTNNRMELMAAIVGLEALTRPCEVELYSDSQYLVKAFNDHWIDGWLKNNWKNSQKKAVKNVDLWKRLLDAKAQHQVHFIWVKGHAGHPENERCDKLATTAADGTNLLDDVYE